MYSATDAIETVSALFMISGMVFFVIGCKERDTDFKYSGIFVFSVGILSMLLTVLISSKAS